MNGAQNRVLAGAIAALLGPVLDQKFGLKLSDAQLVELVGLAPVAYHALAAFAEKCVGAFVMYFPPKASPAAAGQETKS